MSICKPYSLQKETNEERNYPSRAKDSIYENDYYRKIKFFDKIKNFSARPTHEKKFCSKGET